MKKTKAHPVLIIGFNRANLIEALLNDPNLQNREIFIAIDGPRQANKNDHIAHQRIKKIIETRSEIKISHQLINSKNLGCKRAEQLAMTWFFENVEAGIVIEDDVQPSDTFFEFCDRKLEEFKNDASIWSICGHLPILQFIDEHDMAMDYYLSDTPMTYGWASWSRVWQKYQYDLKIEDIFHIEIPRFQSTRFRKLLFKNMWQRRIFDEIVNNVSTWDYQFTVACWKNHSKNVFPKRSLTTNVGYGQDATHTKVSPIQIEIDKVELICKNIEYDNISKNYEIDHYYNQDKLKKIISNWILLSILKLVMIFVRKD